MKDFTKTNHVHTRKSEHLTWKQKFLLKFLLIGIFFASAYAGVTASGNRYFRLRDDGWTGNSATGPRTIYDSSTPDIAWALGATEDMVLNATGLGIGTDDPKTILHVVGEAIRIQRAATFGPRLEFYRSGNLTWSIQGGAGSGTDTLGFTNEDAAVKFLITQAGSVGIDDTIPPDKLSIVGGGIIIQEQADDFAIVPDTLLAHIVGYGDDDTGGGDSPAWDLSVFSTATWSGAGTQDSKVVMGAYNNGVLNADQLVLETDGRVAIQTTGTTTQLLIRTNVAATQGHSVELLLAPESGFNAGNSPRIYSAMENPTGDDADLSFDTYGPTGRTLALRLTSDSDASFVGNIIIADGKTVGQAAGPLLTFDDTDDELQITGGDVTIVNDIVQSADVMYAGKCVIKTIGIAGSGLQFNFASVANVTEQNLDIGALIPARAKVTAVYLECDETVTDGAPQSMGIDVGITSGTDALLSTANTDSDGDTNTTAAAGSPVLAATVAARNVFINATPGVNWSTLTGGEWSIIVEYSDYNAVKTQKGL